jgi:hypothetical protein
VPVDLPEDELRELAEILDAGELLVLRDRFSYAREVRQGLSRFTDRVWFFPFGVHPDTRQPVRVLVNGIGQFMGEEVALVRVGKVHPLTVAVMCRPLGPDELVQAVYVAVPQRGS